MAGSGPRSNVSRSLTIPGPDPQESPIEVVLGPEHAGQRLDQALAAALPAHSRTAIGRWIREGRVTVGGAAVPPKTRVAGGEQVVVSVPPPLPTTLEPEDIPLSILHEEDSFLVVDKPHGLTVHPGHGQRDGTLANALVHHLRHLPELAGSDRPGIVHRLDKDTSGVMVVARTEPAQRALADAFAQRTVEKTYLACVHGAGVDQEGEIDLPIARSKTHRTRMTVVEEGGRAALTRYEVARRLPEHALLHCHPHTGRTHQIRVHCKAIRHPIAGDPIYGWKTGLGEDLVPRLMLHAWKLAFPHPVTGARVAFEAPMPEVFAATVEALAQLPPRRPRRR